MTQVSDERPVDTTLWCVNIQGPGDVLAVEPALLSRRNRQMGKMTKAKLRALSYLSSQLTYVPQTHIPNGNGHTSGGGATNQVMRELRADGFVEYGKNPVQSHCGYRITPAGRAALSQEAGNEA